MTETEFHQARRMFAVIQNTVLIAPPMLRLAHIEWFGSCFGWAVAQVLIKNCDRGYFFNGRMMIYGGDDFSHRVNHENVKLALAISVGIEPIREIGFGAVPGSGQPWEAKVVMSVENYLRRKHGNEVA